MVGCDNSRLNAFLSILWDENARHWTTNNYEHQARACAALCLSVTVWCEYLRGRADTERCVADALFTPARQSAKTTKSSEFTSPSFIVFKCVRAWCSCVLILCALATALWRAIAWGQSWQAKRPHIHSQTLISTTRAPFRHQPAGLVYREFVENLSFLCRLGFIQWRIVVPSRTHIYTYVYLDLLDIPLQPKPTSAIFTHSRRRRHQHYHHHHTLMSENADRRRRRLRFVICVAPIESYSRRVDVWCVSVHVKIVGS